MMAGPWSVEERKDDKRTVIELQRFTLPVVSLSRAGRGVPGINRSLG